MSFEGENDKIKDIKNRADLRIEVIEATKEAFIETAKKFSLPLEMAYKVPLVLEEALVNYQDVKNPEDIKKLRTVAVAAIGNILRMWRMNTPDILEFFSQRLDDALPSRSR